MASYHSAANEGALVEALRASLGAMSLQAGSVHLRLTWACMVPQRKHGTPILCAGETALVGLPV